MDLKYLKLAIKSTGGVLNLFKRKGISSIVIIIILAVILAVGSFFFLQQSNTNVVVINQDLSAGTKITADMFSNGTLTIKTVPKSFVTDGMITTTSGQELINLYITSDVTKGQILTSSIVANTKDGILTNKELIDNNMVLYSLTRESVKGLARIITQGTKINLLFSTQIKGSDLLADPAVVNLIKSRYPNKDIKKIIQPDNTYTVTKTIFQGLKVYAVNRDESGEISRILVGVTPDQAEELEHYMHLGEVTVTMDNIEYKTTITAGAYVFDLTK